MLLTALECLIEVKRRVVYDEYDQQTPVEVVSLESMGIIEEG